nr:uncharacterized protein LOC108066972 [Drosophila takahashii]
MLALISGDAHAKWRFKFKIFGGGKTPSLPHSSPSHSAPSLPSMPSLPSLPDNLRMSYGGGYQSLFSTPAWPIGWNVPGKQQRPPPGFSDWNPLGGTPTNIYARPPAFNPYFKSGATPETSKKSLFKEGGSSSSSGFDYGGIIPGLESRDRKNSTDDNGSSTGLGLGTGLITGSLGGALLGHALTPTLNREVYNKIISIPTASEKELGKTLKNIEGNGTQSANSSWHTSTQNRDEERSEGSDNKIISIAATSEEELDNSWLPVSSAATRTHGPIKTTITHPDDPSKSVEVEYWACFGPDDLNLAEQIFGSISLISILAMALLVSFCLN